MLFGYESDTEKVLGKSAEEAHSCECPEVCGGEATEHPNPKLTSVYVTKPENRLSSPPIPFMLRSIKQLYGDKLSTPEGEIGRVKDFYFDSRQWAVRYVVVDTSAGWLPGRLVLISPHAFGNFQQDADCLLLELTRKQIENAPSIESHRPVSRQYEEAYYRYYGWHRYWDGMELWGGAGTPMVSPPPGYHEMDPGENSGSPNGDDPHLRSTKSVAGYHVHTRDGSIGHVTDYMIDDLSWAVRNLIVETGHWYSGKEIVISPSHIERISYDESTVFVDVTRAAIHDAAEFHMPRARYRESRELSETTA